MGEGSFRAKIKTAANFLTGLIKGAPREIILAIVAAFIYDKYISDGPIKIIVQDDSYVIESGHDRVILPKAIAEAKEKLPHPENVKRHVARAFEVLEDDPSVTDFGIVASLSDTSPVGIIPRADFPRLAILAEPVVEDERRRHHDERAYLVVIKVILERSQRRWQFVWNGIRISAPIKDPEFYNKLASREYQFAQGDVLIATLRIYQLKDDVSGVFMNERYEVIEVIGRQPAPVQPSLLPQ